MGKTVILFDTEGAVSLKGAENFGLNVDELITMPCRSIEQVKNDIFQFLEGVAEDGELGQYVIVIDSLANLESELNLKRMGEGNTASDMGSTAKAMKALFKACTNMGNATNVPIICTNHIYDDPSAMHESVDKNISGGKGSEYLPTVNVQLSKVLMKEGKDTSISDKRSGGQKNYTGVVLTALTTKNRIIKPLLTGKVYLSFSKGLDKYFGLKQVMAELGVIESKGATYVDWEGNKLGFYKSWSKDKKLWEEKLLPELEKRIQEEWQYSSIVQDDDVEEEMVTESEDE